ncbi:MAG: tetratricopeptide repeat protein [Rhodospirillales bacterium]
MAPHSDPGNSPSIELPVPISAEEAVLLAVARHQNGRLDEARHIYRAVLRALPQHPDALHFMGVLEHQCGDTAAAIGLIERSLAVAPGHADAHNNLGNVFREAGRPEDARRAYERAIELNPSHVPALSNLGLVLRNLGRWEDAIASLERARALAPHDPNVLVNLGNVYRQRKRFKDAVVAFREAIALHPYEPEAYRCLAFTLYAMGERAEAVTLLQQWLEVDPANPTARHLCAAYTQEDLPERASDSYVRQIFDSFAQSFDAVLDGLAYRAPQLVADCVAASIGPASGRLSVLDAGCGTGLCAPLLKPYAARLVGIDLSPGMLDRARRTGLYDELVESELTAFLALRPPTFDLIAAADTLCYFGTLRPVLRAIARALFPGGVFAFTLELAEDEVNEQGFVLHVHGRYAHSETAVRDALREAGFDHVTTVTGVLRKERLEDVVGLIVSARRKENGSDATRPESAGHRL